MSMIMQILLGSVLLFVCIAIHIFALLTAIGLLRARQGRLDELSRFRQWALLLGTALAAIIAANTIEVWIFAHSVVFLGATDTIENAIYFALVTYTTLGYGDVVLAEGYRIFGAFGAVTGLLAFGFSTALLISLFHRMVGLDDR